MGSTIPRRSFLPRIASPIGGSDEINSNLSDPLPGLNTSTFISVRCFGQDNGEEYRLFSCSGRNSDFEYQPGGMACRYCFFRSESPGLTAPECFATSIVFLPETSLSVIITESPTFRSLATLYVMFVSVRS